MEKESLKEEMEINRVINELEEMFKFKAGKGNLLFQNMSDEEFGEYGDTLLAELRSSIHFYKMDLIDETEEENEEDV